MWHSDQNEQKFGPSQYQLKRNWLSIKQFWRYVVTMAKTKTTTKKAQTLTASVATKKDTNKGDTTPEGDKKPAVKPTVAKLKDPPQVQQPEKDKRTSRMMLSPRPV